MAGLFRKYCQPISTVVEQAYDQGFVDGMRLFVVALGKVIAKEEYEKTRTAMLVAMRPIDPREQRVDRLLDLQSMTPDQHDELAKTVDEKIAEFGRQNGTGR